jgi:hypothetical protein
VTHVSIFSGGKGQRMRPLSEKVHRFLSQDVARHNAAMAAGQLLRERQQRAEVEAFLAQVDRHTPPPALAPRKSSAGLHRTGP